MLKDSFPSPSRNLQIRKARSTDIAALAELEASAFASDRLTRRRIAALCKSPSACVLVARDGARLLGYALVLTRRGSRVARLYSIAVAPQHGSRGIGRRLLASAEKAAVERGAHRLRLEVRADNRAAIRLYESLDYRPIGRSEDYYADGATALRYERTLRTTGGAGLSPTRRAA